MTLPETRTTTHEVRESRISAGEDNGGKEEADNGDESVVSGAIETDGDLV